ncbi:MAG: nucleotidyltransferase domain-containing protein [Candidatus Nanoarchaeia archaeon]
MDICKLKFTILQLETFRLLCVRAGRKLTQREIAQELDVSATAVAKSLPKLEEEKFIIKQKSERALANYITLNRENPLVIGCKRAENLAMLYTSGLVEHLTEKYAGRTIILFGSYAKGEDIHTSDIDLAVIGKEKKIDVQKHESILHKQIRINHYENLKGIKKELKENLCNGIVLAGSIEL